jgi:hypothetical protein
MKVVSKPKKTTKPAKNKSDFGTPSFCQTRQMGKLQSLGACLASDPGGCKYSLPAIGGSFCLYRK